MKNLFDLIRLNTNCRITGDVNKLISGISQNSQNIRNNEIFVARKGLTTDGHYYIDDVIACGIEAIFCEELPEKIHDNVCYVVSQDMNSLIVDALNQLYDFPSEKLIMVGITGTNGKTSVATALYELYIALGYKVALISTIDIKINKTIIPSTHTTPDVISLYKLLHQIVDNSCSHVFMEVSSHAVEQNRIKGLKYKVAVFTNMTRDHLDYHGSMDNYIRAKKKFFDGLDKDSIAIVNADDIHASIMVQNTKAKQLTYSVKNPSDYKLKILESSFEGLHLKYRNHEWHAQLLGVFNAYNLAAVIAVADMLDAHMDEVLIELSKLKPIDGRFDWFYAESSGKYGVIDYAHTPDALEKILLNLKAIRKPEQRIICVVGCGGNRDRGKRPLMGDIASQHSDHVIFTSDNPRDENPEAILTEIESGISDDNKNKCISLIDRDKAIKTACMISRSGDIILIAGKGHETYQEIKGVKTHFNDKEILKTYL